MAEYRINIEDIFDATDGGLDLIEELYPESVGCSTSRNKKFKIRDSEKTASATLYKNKAGIWLVTDFGGSDNKGKNAIDCYMSVYGVDFTTAINELANKYSIAGADPSKAPKPIKSTEPAESDQEEERYYYNVKESFTDKEIELIFPKNVLKFIGWKRRNLDGTIDENKKKAVYAKIAAVCRKYNFWPLKDIRYIKNREAVVYSSTEDYPMFAWIETTDDKKTFAKLYEPKHIDKSKRFKYSGNKPKKFLHGYKQAKAEYDRRVKAAEKERTSEEDETDSNGQPLVKKKKKQKVAVEKLDQILDLSGGTDAMAAALLGYWVVWPNSETETLEPWQFKNLSFIAKRVIQLQDIDDTGLKMAHQKAMDHLELYTADLPANLRTKRDRRGNPCKDLRDFFNHYEVEEFEHILRTSLPYRFWDEIPKYIGTGEDRIRVGSSYRLNNVHAYNFLSKNGFFRLASPDRKIGFMFIRVEGNIVTEIAVNEVKNFIHQFLQDRYMDSTLRNAMYDTNRLSEGSLSNLPIVKLEFNDTGKHEQYFMFPNVTLHVSADGFKKFEPGSVKRFIWNDDVIPHHFRLQEEPFTIFIDENTGLYDIKINQKDNIFLNYLIQTSRIHWRTEMEVRILKLKPEERAKYLEENKFSIDGWLLTAEEIAEQKQHVINKIFSIGYLEHRFKDPNRPWCIFAMDNNISEDGGSHGGSGKSILYNVALPQVLRKQFYIGGRNPKITENQFIYDGLTEHFRYIYIDDAHEYLNFHFFFDAITAKLSVNPKHASPFKIEYEKVGKFAITSNYTLRNIDPSVERRILYTVFSDYYHTMGESNDYNETRSPVSDFGKNLFSDFTREEWNDFYNCMMHAMRFYFTVTEKIDPPMNNVNTRNLKTVMTPDFEEWAVAYFAETSSNINKPIVREEAYKDFEFIYRKKWTTARFKKALKAFCKMNNYELNPKDQINTKDNRIMHKTKNRVKQNDGTWLDTEEIVTKEFIYIKTKFDAPTFPVAGSEGKQNEIDF